MIKNTLIVIEVDGVLECGNPPGPITIKSLLNLVSLGNMVVLVEKIEEVWSRVDLQGHLLPGFTKGESLDEKLRSIKDVFHGKDDYILVGRHESRDSALRSGFKYVSPESFYSKFRV